MKKYSTSVWPHKLRTVAFALGIAIIVGAVAVGDGSAQTKFKWKFPIGKITIDSGDGTYWAGAIADTASSVGKREAGLFRDRNGIFAAGPNFAFKGGLWTCFKALEWKYPERRRTIMWAKIAAGAAYSMVAIHNAGIAKAR